MICYLKEIEVSENNKRCVIGAEVTNTAAMKLCSVTDKGHERVAGLLLMDKRTGGFRVMDEWGRFWTVQPPTDNA